MIRDLDDKRLGQNSDSSLSPLHCHLFLVTSSLLPLPCRASKRFLAHPLGHPLFRLRGSVGLIVGPAIGGAVSIAREVAIGLSEWSL